LQFELYQWVVPLIAFFYIVRLVNQYKVKKRLVKGTIFWLVFWLGISILAIIPNEVSFKLAEIFGFADNVNAIIFVALGFQFIFLYYLSNSVERLERKVTDLVRKIAMDKMEEQENQDNIADLNQNK